VKMMKWIIYLGASLLLSGFAFKTRQVEEVGPSATAGAQVGIVNHTGKYIYSASVDGAGGANMARWGAQSTQVKEQARAIAGKSMK
jgi:hypothetical protein